MRATGSSTSGASLEFSCDGGGVGAAGGLEDVLLRKEAKDFAVSEAVDATGTVEVSGPLKRKED